MLSTDSSSTFGQHEELTTRLGSLVRQYPAGPGIIKEFIQNADDAGATRLDVVMDWRDHGAALAPNDAIRPLLGPALLIANDAIFTDKNFEEIKEIGESGKRFAAPEVFAGGPRPDIDGILQTAGDRPIIFGGHKYYSLRD